MTAKFGVLINAKVKGENNIKRLGNSMQGVQGKVKNLGNSVKGLSFAFKGLFAAAAIGGMTAFVKSSIDAADAFGKLEVRTGIAANQLQAYVNAGKLADVSQKQLTTGLKTFARTQIEAADGVATYADAYNKLGVQVKATDGSIKASDKLLGEIADKFATLPDGPEKAALAMDIFGKSGADMITLLNGGSKALDKFNFKVSEDFAQNSEYFNDQITTLQIGFEGFKMQLTDALLPALNSIMEAFGDILGSEADFGPLFMTIEAGIRGIASVVLGLVQSMQFFTRVLSDLVKIAQLVRQGQFGQAFDAAKTGLAETKSQFFKDIAAQEKVLFGRSAAPEGYGRRTGRREFEIGDVVGGDSQKKVVKASTKEQVQASDALLKLTKQINQEEIKGNQFALARLDYDMAVLQIQENKLTGNNKELALLRAKGSLNNKLLELFGASVDNTKELNTEAKKTNGLFESIKNTVATGLANAIEGLIGGTKTLSESLSGVLRQMGSLFLQAGTKSLIASIFPSAKGNVFAQNGIVPYAKGGYIGRPTMALMGEAGPEAVLPLQRGPGGKLGVQASGGGVSVGNINITVENTGERLNPAAQKQLAGQVQGIVLSTLANERRSGGML